MPAHTIERLALHNLQGAGGLMHDFELNGARAEEIRLQGQVSLLCKGG